MKEYMKPEAEFVRFATETVADVEQGVEYAGSDTDTGL